MHELDLLKSTVATGDVDPRTSITMSFFDNERGEQHFPTLEEHHASIAPVCLIDQVPEDVRVSFEVAKNLYLYTFFVYRFGVVACIQAYQTLEYALRERAKQAGQLKPKMMLGGLLALAVRQAWLTDDAFHAMDGGHQPGGNRYSLILKETLPGLRNILAHGSFNLFEPHRALEQLKTCAAIINFIFKDQPSGHP